MMAEWCKILFRSKRHPLRLLIKPVLLIGPGTWEEKGDTPSIEI